MASQAIYGRLSLGKLDYARVRIEVWSPSSAALRPELTVYPDGDGRFKLARMEAFGLPRPRKRGRQG